MSTQVHDQPAFMDDVPEEFLPYRAVSKAAVFSLILALLSGLALVSAYLVILPLLGLALGVIGWRGIRRYPDELSGKIPAAVGTLLSGVLLIVSTTMHVVEYATEVPEGYQRVAFEMLKAAPRTADQPPTEALELDGKQVFIKGYVYPDGQRYGLQQFVLVPDLGTCCFGGQPKLTHMIQVTLTDPLRIDYSMRKRKLAGTLRVDQALKPVSGLGGVYYELLADHAK